VNHHYDLRAIARRAMTARGLLPDFGPAVLAQVDGIHAPPFEGDGTIRDLRGLLWCSIDNDDSLDLDQLSVAEALPDGAIKILVAIADVDSLVKKSSPTDEHARHNTTSVYTAAQIFPMLPAKLSTDLTTLADQKERPSFIVEYAVNPDGTLSSTDIYRAMVRNQAKLAYNSVAAWLDGIAPAPERLARVHGLDENLRLQDRAAQALKKLRHEHGALGFQTIEARAVVTDHTVTDLKVEEKNRAKELIEDLMIAANGVTARFLQSKGFPSLRRVVRTPERWPRIVALAKEHGEHLPDQPDAKALEVFLEKRRQADPVRFPDLSLSVVKLMGSGEYAVEFPGQPPLGHFGLAVRDYTHSTAPNRRFPDLITQRMLKAAIEGRDLPYNPQELDELARHCTEMENNAAKVERQVRKSAAALLLSNRIGERFDAIVTGASDKGTWVRTLKPPVEGKLAHGFENVDVADHVKVELIHADVERGFIDFRRV
jgi:exoribonuclease-2